MTAFERDPDAVLAELAQLRAADAPTHGGRVLSYVYDSGVAELDDLAARAARLVQPVNGLDPTTFTSVAAMESALVGFARRAFHGGAAGEPGTEVVGSATSGGTESCLLAVKTARDVWRAAHPGDERMPRLVAPTTVHAAFHKAAQAFGLALDLVPVDPETGAPEVDDVVARLDHDVALVVLSAPSYPFATLDPIGDVGAATAKHEIALHVDACIGGFALAFQDGLPEWDFRVPGVTSLSADLHKYGYAPKGVSVLLQRGRDRQRHQYFATTAWPGYPVVNPTLAGSKPAGPLAAAWAIVRVLGDRGFDELTAAATVATAALREAIDGIEGLRVVGEPVGPLFAVRSDDRVPEDRRVDPHHWADAARATGWHLQLQPGMAQADGSVLPHTAHLTVTPVTAQVLPELVPALVAAADAVRGVAPVDGGTLVAGLAGGLPGGADALAAASASLDSDGAADLLAAAGLLGGDGAGGALPERLAPVLALVEALPGPLTERLLVELLARVVEPRG
ncbi:aminotransferase class V-fold PLP-dependent enzyme [Agromyces tropicus]|uniref:Aminotransferase class V-fold PLP-dependent enzyme n=1 Tax=Agromyces tropicus TaxID=555371 RepID=A0ABN2U2U2_9MICO